MLVNIFRSYGERKRKCSDEDQNCTGRDSRKKILCRTKSAWCSKMKEYVPMGGEGVKRGDGY